MYRKFRQHDYKKNRNIVDKAEKKGMKIARSILFWPCPVEVCEVIWGKRAAKAVGRDCPYPIKMLFNEFGVLIQHCSFIFNWCAKRMPSPVHEEFDRRGKGLPFPRTDRENQQYPVQWQSSLHRVPYGPRETKGTILEIAPFFVIDFVTKNTNTGVTCIVTGTMNTCFKRGIHGNQSQPTDDFRVIRYFLRSQDDFVTVLFNISQYIPHFSRFM